MGKLLITGVTGSFGSAFLQLALKNSTWDIVGISRNEAKQEELWAALNATQRGRVELIPCDITQKSALRHAFWKVDKVIHAAALKRVANSAKFPWEYARINVNGTTNVLQAALEVGAELIFISSDKAVMAHNPYGATKRVGEALTLAYGQGMVVRGGNVWNSSGSVIQVWNQKLLNGQPPIVFDPECTRFHMDMESWCVFVLQALLTHVPGVVLVPKLKSYRLGDLGEAFFEAHGVYPIVGNQRAEDKQHEYLISPIEAPRAAEISWGYVLAVKKEHADVFEGDFVWTVPEHGIDSDSAERLTPTELFNLVSEASPAYELAETGTKVAQGA